MYKIKVKKKCSTLFSKNGYTIEEYSIEKLVSMTIELDNWNSNHYQMTVVADTETEESWYE